MGGPILHLDMDAFYASVEQRDRPELRGVPVIVGGQPERRGVVAAASYEARQYGVRSAMPTAHALELCPHARVIRGRMGYYRSISETIRHVLHTMTPRVEPLSLDEAYLDLAPRGASFADAERIARELKRSLRDRTRLTCSVGIGPTKHVAKIASDRDKPDGLVLVRPTEVEAFLGPLPVGTLSGVGSVTEARLQELGVATVADLRALSTATLAGSLGKWGVELGRRARGIDDRPVTPEHDPKQLSRETTFAQNVADRETLHRVVSELAQNVAADLAEEGRLARTVELKARYADFTTITRSVTLREPIADERVIGDAAELLLAHRVRPDPQGFRLMGVGVLNLVDSVERSLPLFPELAPTAEPGIAQARRALRRRLAGPASEPEPSEAA